MAVALGWMLAVATDFGLQLHLAREISRAPARFGPILRPILRLRVWMALGGLAVSLPIAVLWVGPLYAAGFAAIVAAYVVNALVEFLNYGYRAVSRSDLESTLNLVQRLVMLGAAALALWISPDLQSLGLALLLPDLAILAVSVWLTGRLVAVAGGMTSGVEPAMSRMTFARDVAPIGLGIVLSAIYFRIDLFLLESLRGLQEVGGYNAVFRLIEALRLAPGAILAVLLPAVLRRQDAEFIRRMSAGLVALGLAIAVLGYVSAPFVVDLAYGDRFSAAVPALRVLLFAFPLLSLNYGLTHSVIGSGKVHTYALICAGALVVNLALNAFLIPPLGAIGAAWATGGTEVFLTVALVTTLRHSNSEV